LITSPVWCRLVEREARVGIDAQGVIFILIL